MQKSVQTTSTTGRADYVLVALVMGLMGIFFWAIRGTGGFGGSTGGIFAGMGWGLLWFAFCNLSQMRGPLSTPWMVAAISLGIAFGGMTGYGIYISWLRGEFYLDYPASMRPISPWTGYGMLFICGLQWGGVTGALMAWCHPSCQVKPWQWSLRILAGLVGAWLMLLNVRSWPQLFLPFYSEGIYADPNHKTCLRAIRTIDELAPHLGLYFGFLAFESFRGRWIGVRIMLTVGLGFAIPFTVGGYWQTFQGSSLKLDWWKYWEMSIGLGGGLALGLAFYLFNRSSSSQRAEYNSRAYLLGAGFPVWLGVTRLLFSGYDGILSLHGLEGLAKANRSIMQFCVVLPLTIGYVWWIWQLHHRSRKLHLAIVWWSLSLAIVAVLIHRLAVGLPIDGDAYALILIVVTATFLWLGYWALGTSDPLQRRPLSGRIIVAILVMMCIVGLAASMPHPMRFGNYVLVGSYLICVAASTLLAQRLFGRSTAEQ